MMKKTILVAAIALLASGVALADNMSSTYAGFTATAADGLHLDSDGKVVMGSTNSGNINTAPGAYAGVAGYYTGIAASNTPVVAAGNALAQSGGTYNSIGGISGTELANSTPGTSLEAPAGINAFGQSQGSTGTEGVNISAASGSGAGSSVINGLTKADTSGVTLANGAVYGPGNPGGTPAYPTLDISANSLGTSYATLNPAADLGGMATGYYSKADANGTSSSVVNMAPYATTFGFGGR